MDKVVYQSKRLELCNQAQDLLNAGRLDEFNTIKKSIEDLDNDFDIQAKALNEMLVLNRGNKVTDIEKLSINKKGKVIDTMNNNFVNETTSTQEYRLAFMNYVTKGEAMPAEFKNVSSVTKTTDVGAVIPDNVLQKIIEQMEAVGMILPLVTRTAFKGGVTVPTSSVKPVATWVAEGAGSDTQNKTLGAVTFAYHKLRCAVAVSLEVDEMALPVFEATLINNIVEAMTKAIENAIINGTGVGQPKGILTETPAEEIEITNSVTYADLCAAEGALDLAYEKDAVWFMSKKQFAEILAIVDEQGQPVARVNYGLAGKPERAILGRPVVLNSYMPEGTAAFLFNPKDYILNTSFTMGIKEYYNEDTDDKIKKSVMLVDGKAVDCGSFVKLALAE